MILELCLLALLSIFLRLFVFKSNKEKLYKKFPGPPYYPIVGSVLEFDYPRVEVTETLKQLSYKYGPVFFIKLGLDPVVCLRSPEDVEVILSSTTLIDKSDIYWVLYPWLNQGLLTSKGELWRRHRKILTPAFHFKILEKFVPTFTKNAEILVTKLSEKCEQDINILPSIALCALDIICETAMGLEVSAQQKESKYMDAVNELIDILAHRNFDVIKRTFLFYLLPDGRHHNELISYLHKVTEDIMKNRKAEMLAKPTEEDENKHDEIGIKKKKAFLDLLLEYNMAGAGLTDTEIREEVDTFMFEGYDTTTSTSSFCLYALSQHQHVQAKVYEEIKQIFGDSEREITYQDLQEMKYLDKVIKETLRRYATIAFIGRQCYQEVKLPSGYTVPKNTSVLILIEAMNHDPLIHPEPLKFDPDRFDNKNANPYAFVPFSAGPRNCIGQKYAVLEVKAVVSSVLRKFSLLPSDIPIAPWFTLVLKSKTGINLKLKPRFKS